MDFKNVPIEMKSNSVDMRDAQSDCGRQSHVAEQMDRQFSLCGALEGVYALLSERLSAVSMPRPMNAIENRSDQEVVLLASQLRENNDRIEGHLSALHQLLQSIEL